MKKVFAVAFIAILAVSCSKKKNELQDSNAMLPEPEVKMADSSATKPAEPTAVTAGAAPAVKADSATAKK